MKKKKKKSKKESDDAFAAKLAALDIDKEDAEESEAVQEGDMYVAFFFLVYQGYTDLRRDVGKLELVFGATTKPPR